MSPDDTTFAPAEFGMTFAGPLSFARLATATDPAGLDLAVVGVPFDLGTTNRPGARLGPRAIREQSSLVGEYPEGLWPWGYHIADRHRVADLGDISHPIGSLDSMLDRVTERAAQILAAGASLLALGGDHLVAYPLLRAYAERFGPISLVHLDAHSDTWEDSGYINHGSMFWRAANEGLVDPATSVQIGMRTPNETHGFTVIDAEQLCDRGVESVAQECHQRAAGRPVYLSVDIDFLDPAFAPGTGTPVIGGPTTGDARRLLRALGGLDIVGADLVEVAPPYDHAGITALAGATLALDQLYLLGEARVSRQRG